MNGINAPHRRAVEQSRDIRRYDDLIETRSLLPRSTRPSWPPNHCRQMIGGIHIDSTLWIFEFGIKPEAHARSCQWSRRIQCRIYPACVSQRSKKEANAGIPRLRPRVARYVFTAKITRPGGHLGCFVHRLLFNDFEDRRCSQTARRTNLMPEW